MILDAVKAVMPSFVARVERPDRGGEWVSYLEGARARRRPLGRARLGLDASADARDARPVGAPAARRRRRGRAARRAALRGRRRRRGGDAHPPGRAVGADERAELLADLVGERANRRHRPGRGFEALRYRFEIVSDYGAFRDLQRHRMLTVQWQRLTPHLGAGVPEEVEAAGCGDDYRRALEVSRAEWERLAGEGREREALYALCLGYRIRYVLDLNAREAMQLIELRSGREGHPSYRAVAHEMHRLIAAGPPRRRGRDDARRHRGRAAARAHPQRDAHAGQARRAQRALSATIRLHSGPRGN